MILSLACQSYFIYVQGISTHMVTQVKQKKGKLLKQGFTLDDMYERLCVRSQHICTIHVIYTL